MVDTGTKIPTPEIEKLAFNLAKLDYQVSRSVFGWSFEVCYKTTLFNLTNMSLRKQKEQERFWKRYLKENKLLGQSAFRGRTDGQVLPFTKKNPEENSPLN